MDTQPLPESPYAESAVTRRREQRSWYVYDWANSTFSTTVVTVFLGPYLTTITKAAADAEGFVHPFGVTVAAGSYFPYIVSLSVLLQVICLPILGAVADYTHRKKQMLALFAYVGAAATMGMYFLQGTNYLLGGGLFLVANVSFGAAMVFYNAFLPDIATPDERNTVSSYGWAAGYLGGGLLLGANLLLVSQANALGLTTGEAVRICLASAGVWWAVFTLVPLIGLRNRASVKVFPAGKNYVTAGISQLWATFREARAYPHTLLFLLAFLIYNDGIQTVITLSSQFGQEQLGLPVETLVSVVLMVQFVAFIGSLVFNRIARLIGTKPTVILSLVIWTATLGYAYGYLETALQFYALGAVTALVLGGSQALSRSLFSLMIPKGHEAEYFGLYEVSDKGTSWLGPLFYGLALQFTGSYRLALLSMAVFFLVGILILTRVDIRAAAKDAGNLPLAEA